MAKSKHGVWKYVASDKFDKRTLQSQRDFYKMDLILSQQYLAYLRRYKSVPNYKWMVKRAEEDVKISKENLRLVELALHKY